MVSLVAQSETDQPIYQRFPELPPLSLLEPDSSTVFTEKDLKKNIPTLVMVFSPDCDHCKKETEDILQEADKFKKIQIVMATPLSFEKMRTFYEEYKLADHENFKVGQDTRYLLMSFYSIHTLPFMAFYDKKGKLIDARQGNMTVADILEKFKQKP